MAQNCDGAACMDDSKQPQTPEPQTSNRPGPDYRHFNGLIWRVPVWSTGLLTATMLGLSSATQETLAKYTGASASTLTISYVLLMFFAMIAFSFILHRVRVHQRAIVKRTGVYNTPIWKSSTFYFNELVCCEAAFPLTTGLLFLGFNWVVASIASLLLAVVLSAIYEISLRRS